MVGLDNPLHIALVLIVVLMVFGAKRLPEMGKGLGEGMRGFKQAISGETPVAPAQQISLAKVDEHPATAPLTTTEQQTPTAPVA
jgi:sec-independent protein translocase protein TatA